MPEYILHFQLHYMQRQSQRGFADDDCQLVVNSPEKKFAQGYGQHGGIKYRFEKTIRSRKLVVIAEILKNDAYLITAFFKDE